MEDEALALDRRAGSDDAGHGEGAPGAMIGWDDPPVPDLTGELWIVTHVDLESTAAVRVLMDEAAAALRRRRDLLEGRLPAGVAAQAASSSPRAG